MFDFLVEPVVAFFDPIPWKALLGPLVLMGIFFLALFDS